MFNRKNLLDKIRKVNEVYLKYKSKGEQNEFIYQNYIREQFNISRSTFYAYLTVPYKRELNELLNGEQSPEQSEDLSTSEGDVLQ